MQKEPRKVLVIDGLADRRSFIRAALEAVGFTVSVASSGGRGLSALRADRFEILLTDICERRVDGLTVIKRAREYPHLRILAMTSDNPPLPLEIAITLAEVWGAERVFAKNFDVPELLAAIDQEPSGASDVRSVRTRVG